MIPVLIIQSLASNPYQTRFGGSFCFVSVVHVILFRLVSRRRFPGVVSLIRTFSTG